MNKTGASSWLDSRIKKAALEKLSNVQTVVWPSQKFLSPSRLEEVYKHFPEDATSFTEFWIEARRSQRLLFGTDAATEELLLGNNYNLPYVEYVQVLNHPLPLHRRTAATALLLGRHQSYVVRRCLVPLCSGTHRCH
ncbi:hypothetical protein HPB51_000030 [Rhipicephalus microplus]|uniref:Uncharacterized protein n=1 Tax=Rhipicephalus microplus TaxID=6941 RepID=A0A9J6DY24_RHIMP|nr:hypothetical protein HPB51_000030 [Rhipicephalus microplus]